MPDHEKEAKIGTPRALLIQPPEDTVPAFWRMAAQRHAELPLVARDEVWLSFAEVDRRSAALARGLLAEGAAKGERIGLLAPNSPDWVIAWLAINRIGAIAVCLSTFYAAPELAYAIRHADVSTLLTADRYLRHDYLRRLEEAFPGLAEADGEAPLALPGCPYLRSIWTTSGHRPWACGSLDDLMAIGEGSASFGSAMLEAVEAEVSSADLAMLIYTSGSTAAPKGVVHTQGTVVRKTLFMAGTNTITPIDLERGDRMVVPAPFFWIGGFLNLSCAMALGACVVCVDEHSPTALLAAVRREGASYLGGAEPALRAIATSPDFRPGDFDDLKPLNVGQIPYFRDPQNRRRALMPNSLGMTETFGPHSGETGRRVLSEDAAGSMGAALPGVRYKILDRSTGEPTPDGTPGELYVQTSWLMAGMYKLEREAVFDADGYYATGDECMRRDGYLWFLSRLGGCLKTSGANVAPEEVEAAIQSEPGVVEAAVIGLPDAELGQKVVVAVVKSDASDLDAEGLKTALRAKLSSFKVPKEIFFFAYDDLPRTPSKKVRKPMLADLIAQRREGAI